MAINVKLLRKVKKHILEEPKRLYMSYWVKKRGSDNIGRSYAKCGTAACIAGWACILSGKNVEDIYPIERTAEELLGLNADQSYALFQPDIWPRKFKGGITNDGKKRTAEIAAARIEHFIKTDGQE